ncbi:MAG: PD-(D/E)XK nuclease family protein, partial [Planctomycetaceae bacterium]
LQLQFYLLAVVDQGLAGPLAVGAEAAFWALLVGGFSAGLQAPGKRGSRSGLDLLGSDEWAAARQDLERVVPRIVLGMRRGEFPVFNRDENCQGHCPHRLSCRVGQVRALDERLLKRLELLPESGESQTT